MNIRKALKREHKKDRRIKREHAGVDQVYVKKEEKKKAVTLRRIREEQGDD